MVNLGIHKSRDHKVSWNTMSLIMINLRVKPAQIRDSNKGRLITSTQYSFPDAGLIQIVQAIIAIMAMHIFLAFAGNLVSSTNFQLPGLSSLLVPMSWGLLPV